MTERERFEAWFYASKYAQVILPNERNEQIAWDGWQAALAQRTSLTDRLRAKGFTDAPYPSAADELLEGTQRTEQEPRYVLSCGCRSLYGGFPAQWDSETRDCQSATSFGQLCERHFYEYNAEAAQYAAPVLDDVQAENGRLFKRNVLLAAELDEGIRLLERARKLAADVRTAEDLAEAIDTYLERYGQL